jgi:hypothetical protein
MMFAPPTLSRLFLPAWRLGVQARILHVLPAMYAVATSSLENNAALLAGGPGVVIGDRSSKEIANLISQTGAIGIVDALLHDTPQAQGVE